jgi:hypothetical protein
MDAVVKALDRECLYGGESFYYSIPFGPNRVEGGSIGLAQSIVREWGNVAVNCSVDENDDAFIFTATFIDLEKGSQIQRTFRQRKSGFSHGKFDPERKLDISYQIGQSKALRNVIFSGVPRWLIDRCIEQAKAAVVAKITPDGLEVAKDKAVAAFKSIGVDEARLIAKVGHPRAEWTTRDLADLRGDIMALKNGEMSVAELFPAAEQKAPEGVVNVEALKAAVQQPQAQAVLPAEDPSDKLLPAPMSEEEKRKAVEK